MKVLLDTSVLISFFRNPAKKAEFESRTGEPLLHMSSVVVLELLAGCRTAPQQKALISFLKPFEKANRLLTPDYKCFREAGRILAELGRAGIGAQHRCQIVNDVLIAVTARHTGAVVITSNAKDFSLIARHTPVRWMLPD